MEHTSKVVPNTLFFEQVDALLQNGQRVTLPIKGNSMLPFLREGKDNVVLESAVGWVPKPGDTMLFVHFAKHLLHRVIAVKEDLFLMRGDGCRAWQVEQEPLEQMVAVMTHVIRPSGRCVSVKSVAWRLPSWLWRHAGAFFRRAFLWVYNKI